ncbi:MAG: glycosyltransferase family 4 protein [bacterium]|nr:glycosyltransferase family 4 protein [bacterium]
MSKNKICICSAQIPFRWGGAEILVDSLKQELTQRGFEVEQVKLPFKWYPKEEIVKSAFAWRLIDITESYGEKIDLVIGTKFPSYLVKHPNKLVWLVHQHRPAYDLFGKNINALDPLARQTYFNFTIADQQVQEMIIKMDNTAFQECNAIYTISKTVAGRLQRYNGITGIVLYPPPRNLPKPKKTEYGNFIFTLGRLEAVKRFDLLIEAMRYVKSKAQCIIAGSGYLNTDFEYKIQQYGISDRVKLTGFVDDATVSEYYATCFATFYAPIDEDYGYVTVESFREKKPVITTNDAGGTLEFVEHNVTGLVANPTPEDIALQIDTLYENKTKCQEFGEAGFEKVQKINWETVINELTKTIK